MSNEIKFLPPDFDVESKTVLKKLASAHRYLAELKGVSKTIPNESILINTLTLQEAKDSSAIENIITTHDELFKAQLFENITINLPTKEVNNYANALKQGFEIVRSKKMLSNVQILEIQKLLEQNDAGYRRLPGTALVNQATNETVYTPPQNYDSIVKLMDNLVEFINNDKMSELDPLIKMALIHHQFETIHPFYDGNGRTGRIINILYLVLSGLLDLPVLYLSRYIIKNKSEYYNLLQKVRDTGNWEEWILYILNGVEQTAKDTIILINEIRTLMLNCQNRLREQLPKIYSQDLVNNLFRHPYTKIEFLMKELQVSKPTAVKYLNALVTNGFLYKQKIWKNNFYINEPLFNLFKKEQDYAKSILNIETVNEKRIV